jgi:hypothetical protein
MVDNLVGAKDGAAGHGVAGGGEKKNLRFWVLGAWFGCRGSSEVRQSWVEVRDDWLALEVEGREGWMRKKTDL